MLHLRYRATDQTSGIGYRYCRGFLIRGRGRRKPDVDREKSGTATVG
jgi:hypothetical protein